VTTENHDAHTMTPIGWIITCCVAIQVSGTGPIITQTKNDVTAAEEYRLGTAVRFENTIDDILLKRKDLFFISVERLQWNALRITDQRSILTISWFGALVTRFQTLQKVLADNDAAISAVEAAVERMRLKIRKS